MAEALRKDYWDQVIEESRWYNDVNTINSAIWVNLQEIVVNAKFGEIFTEIKERVLSPISVENSNQWHLRNITWDIASVINHPRFSAIDRLPEEDEDFMIQLQEDFINNLSNIYFDSQNDYFSEKLFCELQENIDELFFDAFNSWLRDSESMREYLQKVISAAIVATRREGIRLVK